jgi:hypothetical protein
MDDLSSMRTRVAYLKRQAEEFRRLSEFLHDDAMRAQILELAGQCDAIADNIRKNMPIHERLRRTALNEQDQRTSQGSGPVHDTHL